MKAMTKNSDMNRYRLHINIGSDSNEQVYFCKYIRTWKKKEVNHSAFIDEKINLQQWRQFRGQNQDAEMLDILYPLLRNGSLEQEEC